MHNPELIARSFDLDVPLSSNFVEILRERADNRPLDIAYRFVDQSETRSEISYATLWSRVRSIASHLQASGAAGRRVILLYPAGLEFICGFFGVLAAGSVAVPANLPRRNRKRERIDSILQDSGAGFILTVASELSRLKDDSGYADLWKSTRLIASDELSADFAANWRMPRLNPTSVALLQYTSGATSDPKGVVISHGNLVRNCELIAHGFSLCRTDLAASWLPSYHDMGLVGGVLMPMFAGWTITLMNPSSFFRDPISWLRVISNYRVTATGGPDFGYQLCLDKITDADLNSLDLSCWEVAFTGAEPVRPETLRQFAKTFAPAGFRKESFLPCYGLAEATLIVTGGPRGNPVCREYVASDLDRGKVVRAPEGSTDRRELAASGRVLPGESLAIVDPETLSETGLGLVGEIWVNSPANARGYWNNAIASKAAFEATLPGKNGHYLRTGDLGFLDGGRLFVTGRIKDLIVLRGLNRYPQDIELTCEESTEVVQRSGVAAFSMMDEEMESLVIVAETLRGRNLDFEIEMQRMRSKVIAEHGLSPGAIHLVKQGAIPRTTSGKIQRSACRMMLASGDLLLLASSKESTSKSTFRSSESRSSGNKETCVSLVSGLSEIVQSHTLGYKGEISPDTHIAMDLGLDSVERMALAHSLEKAFGGHFPDGILLEIETLGDLSMAAAHYLGCDSFSAPARVVSPAPLPDLNDSQATSRFENFPEVIGARLLRTEITESGFPNPYFTVHDGPARETIKIDGRELINFSSYNYLGLSGHPEVSEAAEKAIRQYGTSCSASRLVSGNLPVHEALEFELADFLGTERALVFVGGHSTNETTIGHLFAPGDLIMHDSLAHNSILQGAQLSGAKRWPFAHNDCSDLERILKEVRNQYRRVLIAVEGAYSMDGDTPDLTKLVEIKKRFDCLLMVDEAHSLGTLGTTGRGLTERCGVSPHEVDILMGTLSKALASCGGFIAGSTALIDYLRYTAPGFVYSVGIPPSAAAAALSAIQILRREPDRVERLRTRSRQFLKGAIECGFNVGESSGTPIIPLITGKSETALALSHSLLMSGINAPPILYPAVSDSSARLRFFISANHSETQIRTTLETLSKDFESPSTTGMPRSCISSV